MDIKDALRRAIEIFGPQVDLIGNSDQLHGNANAARFASDAALEHIIHAQLLPDSRDRLI
jgi:hypothetical protein